MTTKLLSCAIVTSYEFSFREDDLNRENKTKALKDCIYRKRGRRGLGFWRTTCLHPKASEDSFLSTFCPRAVLFFGK